MYALTRLTLSKQGGMYANAMLQVINQISMYALTRLKLSKQGGMYANAMLQVTAGAGLDGDEDPADGETLSQLPPSVVVALMLQSRAILPRATMLSCCRGGAGRPATVSNSSELCETVIDSPSSLTATRIGIVSVAPVVGL